MYAPSIKKSKQKKQTSKAFLFDCIFWFIINMANTENDFSFRKVIVHDMTDIRGGTVFW